MSDKAALLAAICAAPGEDTPRLALADWLAEHEGREGEARAKWIRLQVESHRLAPPLSLRDTHPELKTTITPIWPPNAPPKKPPARRIPAEHLERVAELEKELESLRLAFGPAILLGVAPGDWLTVAGPGHPQLDRGFLAEHPRRTAGRQLSAPDLFHGTRRGFFGALVCCSVLWENESEAICARFPIEEVQFVTIPFMSIEALEDHWPGIRFNPRSEG